MSVIIQADLFRFQSLTPSLRAACSICSFWRRASLRGRSRLAGVAAGVAALALATVCAADNSGRHLLEAKESLYNNIYVYRDGNYISMNFGHNKKIYTESVFNSTDELDLPVEYTRFMTVGLAYAPPARSVLEIGFGGGRTASYLHLSLPAVAVTSVELDPAIVQLAQKYFGVRPGLGLQVVTADGRIFLRNTPNVYDVILIDAYRGPFVPFHLLTKEFYELVRAHLKPGGVVVQNIEPSTMLFDSSVKTLGSVFSVLDFYLAEGNVVTVAYDGQRLTKQALTAQAAERQSLYRLRYDLSVLVSQRRVLSADSETIKPGAQILTDDFAPVEALKAIEKHNRKWPQTM
jgi:spermidine synthase